LTKGLRGIVLELFDAMDPGYCLADTAHDSDTIRAALVGRGIRPVSTHSPPRRPLHPFELSALRMRNVIERNFSRLIGPGRIATNYDKFAKDFLAAFCLLCTVRYWL